MIKLQTPVTDLECRVNISYTDKILMLGSCFSDNIGTRLCNYGFDVLINPTGTLYNPASILSCLRRIESGRMFTEDDCCEIGAGDMRICSFHHHTSFARQTAEEFIANANARLDESRKFFKECSKVIITLGTSWCYHNIDRGMIVANCLKRNPKEFEREFLGSEDTYGILEEIVEICKGKELIFTISPIRHFKDGAHANQISKAALLLAIDKVMSDTADYFPAYEIMMDELRDYRFYAEDMCHPSQQAADYICERFLDWALPDGERTMLKENIRTYRHGCHISK